MIHPVTARIAIDERASLSRSIKSHLLSDLELDQSNSLYGQYVVMLVHYLDTLIGAEAIIKSLRFWRRPTLATKQNLAEYLEDRINNRFTDKSEQALIQSAGKRKALVMIKAAEMMIESKTELIEMLAEYGTAYTDATLDITAQKEAARLNDSEKALAKKVGTKRADALKNIIATRIDAELNDYLARVTRNSREER